jgi:signal transduction histidine kinase
LEAVLGSLCQEFAVATGIKCLYQASFDEAVLDYEIKLDFFRICQEALLNVMHHAQASQVNIRVKQKANRVELSVTDNGKGFDHHSKQKFGFRNMHGRAASINGELTVTSKKNKGTRVSVSVEVKKSMSKMEM